MSDSHDDPEGLPLSERLAIKAALEAKGAVLPCPRCSGDRVEVLDRYFFHVNQHQTQVMTTQGKGILTVVVGCSNCGYLMQHATNLLGITRTRCEVEAEQRQTQPE